MELEVDAIEAFGQRAGGDYGAEDLEGVVFDSGEGGEVLVAGLGGAGLDDAHAVDGKVPREGGVGVAAGVVGEGDFSVDGESGELSFFGSAVGFLGGGQGFADV